VNRNKLDKFVLEYLRSR